MISMMYHLMFWSFRTMVMAFEEQMALGPSTEALEGNSPDAVLEKKRLSKSPQVCTL